MKTAKPEHLFVGDNGAMFDTRRANWSSLAPLRPVFERNFRTIENTLQLRACLRAGEYVFPGGYRLAFVTKDGALLSFAAVRDNYFLVVDSLRGDHSDGWRVCGLIDVDNSDSLNYCDHSGELLGGYDDEENENE